MTRRRFLELAVAGASGAFLVACTEQGEQPTSTAVPVPRAGPTSMRGRKVQNENRPDRNIRYFRPFVPPTPQEWRLTVSGLVSTPLTLTFSDIQQFPVAEQASRMKCVECWSYKAQWSGFRLTSLLEQAKPKPAGQYLRMTCGDEYWEVHSVEELTRDRVLFVYRMDGEFLTDEYGSPLRVVIPWKYGYKGAKCITGMEFVPELSAGYWSTVGPYTIQGDIQEGYDFPQDIGERRRITEPGKELAY